MSPFSSATARFGELSPFSSATARFVSSELVTAALSGGSYIGA